MDISSVWRNPVDTIPVEKLGAIIKSATIEDARTEFPVIIPVETEFPASELK